MTETSHTRARGAALQGLILQCVAAAALLLLFAQTRSSAMSHLAWYILGGVPIWFVSLLVFRQRELAALEKMDLDALRREKQTTGGGEALFDGEGGGGLGFMVAEARLRWMERWLIPGFGLATALYLIAVGLVLLGRIGPAPIFEELQAVKIWLLVLAVVMLFQFLFARWAVGLGRAPQWQHLRACGSYMLGNAVAMLALVVALGILLYAKTAQWEHYLSYGFPALMVLLGLETCLNFVLDIYRPRAPGAEPRACFDSRLLGLIAEPRGITNTIAKAIDYQFGFEVSQTWFYRLLVRWAVPLVLVGVLSLWVLTTVVVVQPYEHAIIERFGRQVNAADPLAPGLHWKWPWPIEVARKYNTGQLHQIVIGHDIDVLGELSEPQDEDELEVELWTGARHAGEDHFHFLVGVPPAGSDETESLGEAPGADANKYGPAEEGERVPVNVMLMKIAVQYRILPQKLAAFSANLSNSHDLLRDVAWQELVRYCASTHTHDLLGPKRATAGADLRRRIANRIEKLNLGLEIVYVGLLGVHPENTVAEAFRSVIQAEQEKITEIRKARVTENETLARVVGDTRKALRLYEAISNRDAFEKKRDAANRVLSESGRSVPAGLQARLDALEGAITPHVKAARDVARAGAEFTRIQEDFELALGGSALDVEQARRRLDLAVRGEERAAQALQEALVPIRRDAEQALGREAAGALVDSAEAVVALAFWNAELTRHFERIEGAAAIMVEEARALRWERELAATLQVAQFRNEYEAYSAAPEIYTARSYLRILTEGVRDARKYIIAFDRKGRNVHTRIEAQEPARPDILSTPVPQGTP